MFDLLALIRLSWRSIWRNWRRTLITVSAISGGLALALFAVAFAYGSHAQVVDEAVRVQAGHLTLEHEDYREAAAIDLSVKLSAALREKIQGVAGVASTKTLLQGQGVAKSGSGVVGVAVMGVEPQSERLSSPVAKSLIEGEYLEASDRRKVLVGSKLAHRLKLKVGKKLVLSSNNVDGDVVEELYRVKGIFELRSPEMDGHLVQIPVKAAQRFYGLSADEFTQVGVIVEDLGERDRILQEVRVLVKGESEEKVPVVLPWEVVLADLASFIRIDRASNWVINLILIFLSLFTIWNTILMSVLERTREFAMMLALGTSPALVRAQILVESFFIGAGSVMVGLGAGGACAFWVKVHGIDMSELIQEDFTISGFSFDPVIYAKPELNMFLWLGALVFVATIVISFFSSLRVQKISISNVLR